MSMCQQAWSYADGDNCECLLVELKEDKSYAKPRWEIVWKCGKSCPLLVGFNSSECNQLKGTQPI